MKCIRFSLLFIGLLAAPAAWARVPYPEVELPPVVEDDGIFERIAVAPPQPVGRAGACSVTIRGGLPSPQPVYLKTDSEDFYPFSDVGVMEFESGGSLQLWCPSGFNTHSENLITANCVSGTTFSVGGSHFEFKDLYCKSWPGFKAIKSGATCNGGIVIRVGFEITSSRFAEQMQICFNEEEEVTRYTRHK
ncbi:uncharacterized protein Dyak_GE28722, partial [Drosophila yakuba]